MCRPVLLALLLSVSLPVLAVGSTAPRAGADGSCPLNSETARPAPADTRSTPTVGTEPARPVQVEASSAPVNSAPKARARWHSFLPGMMK
jgi:anti-sigma factor RsiW